MKGWRTLVVGLFVAVAPAGLQYLAGFDWASVLGPAGAFAVAGVIQVAMRFVTTTPVGVK